MDRKFNNVDFERLLRDNANQYKMYPSEKVWKGVNSALHSNRKWYGITALSLLILISTGLGLFFFTNNKTDQSNLAAIKKPASAISNNLLSTVTILNNTNSVNPVTEKRDNNYFEKTTRSKPDNIALVKKSNAVDVIAQDVVHTPVIEVVEENIEKKINDSETIEESVVSENGELNTNTVKNSGEENNDEIKTN